MKQFNLSSGVISMLRVASLGVKLFLSLFIARRFGAQALGSYGLMVGAASLAPAVFGFGLNGALYREIVSCSRDKAVALMATKLFSALAVYAVIFPAAMLIPVDGYSRADLLLFICVILTEHILSDVNGAFISRNKAVFANVFLLLRTGAWPAAFIALSLAANNIDFNFLYWIWLGGNVLALLWLADIVRGARLYESFHIDLRWLVDAIRKSYMFYVYDVGYVGYQYADRFIIGATLGLDAAGVYSLFSSIVISTVIVIYSATIQPTTPRLIGSRHEVKEFRSIIDRTARLAVAYSIVAACALFVIYHFVSNHALDSAHNLKIWAFVAMVLSIAPRAQSELYHLVLYCAHRDALMTASALCGMAFALALSLIGSYLFGITGSSFSFLASSVFLLSIRWALVRGLFRPRTLSCGVLE